MDFRSQFQNELWKSFWFLGKNVLAWPFLIYTFPFFTNRYSGLIECPIETSIHPKALFLNKGPGQYYGKLLSHMLQHLWNNQNTQIKNFNRPFSFQIVIFGPTTLLGENRARIEFCFGTSSNMKSEASSLFHQNMKTFDKVKNKFLFWVILLSKQTISSFESCGVDRPDIFLLLYGPFSLIGFTCLRAAEPLRTASLLLPIKSPWVPGTFKFKFYGHILRMGFNCLKATEPLQGDSLLCTTQSPVAPGTHLINLRRMKSWVDLGATQQFSTWDPELGILYINHYAIWLLIWLTSSRWKGELALESSKDFELGILGFGIQHLNYKTNDSWKR